MSQTSLCPVAFHIRYTCSGQLQNDIVNFISKNALDYIISKEYAAREHIQCYVLLKVTKKTWVNKFNIVFKDRMETRDKYVEPDKGSTKFYVCKGDNCDTLPNVISKRGFTDDDISIFHKTYWDTQTKTKDNVVKVNPDIEFPIGKVKRVPPMRLVRDRLEELYPEKDWSMKDKPLVAVSVLNILGEGCKTLDHIILSRMTYGVLNSLVKNKKEWHEYWYHKAFGEELNPTLDDNYLDE